MMMAKVNMVQIPYSGGTGPAVVGAISGEAPVLILPISAVIPQARVERLRVLAITLPERASAYPDVPAIAESLPGFSAFQWYGVLAPARTPRNVVDRLNSELTKVMQGSELKGQLLRDGAIVVDHSTPEQFAAHMRDEKVKWAKVVEVSGAAR
jgi:tripartite-type tricarboxylate transporter receptor subunit TctC